MECGPRAIPPGGYHYPERPGQEPIRASGFDELVAAIIRDRIANAKPIGNPALDLQNYVTTNFPSHASSVSLPAPTEESIADAPMVELRERVSRWLANRYGQRAAGHCDLADQEEADRRAKICEACTQNQDFSRRCPPCSESIARTSFLVTQGQKTSPEVKSCAVTGQLNNAACFLPKGPMLAYADKFKGELAEKAPHCWLLE